MNIFKHILLSQLLIILLQWFSANLKLYSNQIYAFHNQMRLKEFQQFNSDNLHQKNYHNQQTALQPLQISKFSTLERFLLSHCQFDGIQFFDNQYSYEPNYAFIKGYTLIIQSIKLIVNHTLNFIHITFDFNQTISSIISKKYIIQIIVLILINKMLIVLSAFKLKQIALILTKNNLKKSQIITLIFIYNPSTIFFNSIYSQSIYSWLTFNSIFYLLKSYQLSSCFTYFKSIIFLTISTFFRTNAIFLSPIVGLPIIYQLWMKIKRKQITKTILTFLKGILVLLLLIAPFIWYLYYTFSKLCSQTLNPINLINDKLLNNACTNYTLFPNLYNFVQQKYWSVGFLRYIKAQNSIFILIGLPSLIFSFNIFKSLKQQSELFIQKQNSKIDNDSQQLKQWQKGQNIQLIKIGMYLSFVILYLITIFLTNIQSSTRFFASHPIFYFLIYDNLNKIQKESNLNIKLKDQNKNKNKNKNKKVIQQKNVQDITFEDMGRNIISRFMENIVKLWIFTYFSFGTILFSIGFPWT